MKINLLNILLILFINATLTSCERNIELDQDYSVFYDDIGKGYKLFYYREGILRGQYCYEIGYDSSYIIVKSSSTPQSKEDKYIKYNYYIIDKAQYKSNLAYPKNPGLFGPFDHLNFEKFKKQIAPTIEFKYFLYRQPLVNRE